MALKKLICFASLAMMGWGGVLATRRHHDSSVNTLTTNASIKNQTN